MKHFLFLLSIVFFYSSCNDIDYYESIEERSDDMVYADALICDSVLSRSSMYPYFLEFDIYTEAYGDEKYYTFLVLNAQECALYDRDPFLYDKDDNDEPVVIADPILYTLYHGSSKVWFDERGLTMSVAESYDVENDIVVYSDANIGDRIAIFASKEKYTNEDLIAHSGDISYFNKVSESFECYYITTLKSHTTIGYGMWSPDWWG